MNNKNKAYEFWNTIKNPKTALAPMAECNDLPFRLICRKYGTELTYTQMYDSEKIINDDNYRQMIIKSTSTLDNPNFIQLNGNDPDILLKSANYLQKYCQCIDINLGCPQTHAKKFKFGSYLAEDEEKVYKIIGYLANNENLNISCKIRLFNDLERTYSFCRKLEDLGIKVLCIHGRTKEQVGLKKGLCNIEAIKNIKNMINIPLIANGCLKKKFKI